MSNGDTTPSSPPFESGSDTARDPGTVRERVRGVAMTLTEEQDVKTIAEMADCSKEGARTALREYAEMGLVTRTNDDPEKYERNPAFLRFRRGLDLAAESTAEELHAEYQELRERHEAFASEFEVDHPRAVETLDELPTADRDAVSEWQGVIERAGDVREAYWQRERKALPPLDAAPQGDEPVEPIGVDEEAVRTAIDDLSATGPVHAALVQVLIEEVATNGELQAALLSAVASSGAADITQEERANHG